MFPLHSFMQTKKRLCPNRQRRLLKRGSTLFGMTNVYQSTVSPFPTFEPDNGGFIRLRLLFSSAKYSRVHFRKRDGLNHFQQVMVLSNKHRLLTSPYLRVYCVRLLFTTILHFQLIVNIKYFVIVVLFYPYLIRQLLLVNLDHVFVQLQLHE